MINSRRKIESPDCYGRLLERKKAKEMRKREKKRQGQSKLKEISKRIMHGTKLKPEDSR
jgi:hypothetical protein